jgi:hypothetical protein
VRLRTHSHCGVEVPVRLKIHWPVTEGYCVVATRGGELPEVNCQSVTKLMQRQQQRKLKQQVDGMRLSGQREIRAVAQASYERVLAPARKASDTATCAKQTVSHKKGHLAINRSKETEWQEA